MDIMMTEGKIGIYRLSDNKAKSYCDCSEIYIMGEYEIDEEEGLIKIGGIVDSYDNKRLIPADESDFKVISATKTPMEEGKKLFAKYGIDVDVVSVFHATKGENDYLISIAGMKF